MRFWQDISRFGDSTAFVEAEGGEISYSDLARAADAMELPSGSLLLIALDNSIASMVAYLSALRRGCPAILINAGDDVLADRIMAAFAPAAMWSPARGLESFASSTLHDIHPDLCLLLSTSGSTGQAKLVRLSGSAVDSNARAIAQCLEIDSAERAITTLPPGYCYGLSIINSHLAVGATTILYKGSVIDREFRSTVESLEVTSFGGVPHTYQLLDCTGFLDDLPASIRTMTQAGGKLAPELVESVAQRAAASAARFFVMYGQTEATARMGYVPADAVSSQPDCIGMPIPGGAFDIVDPLTGLPSSKAGELVYSGPNIMMGYAQNVGHLSSGHEVERLFTGDLVERTPSGLYRITGRKSRIAKLFGLRISLDEVEAILHEAGIEAAVASKDERLIVGVTSETEQGAQLLISKRLGIPRGCVRTAPLQELPRLPSGKIDYAQLVLAADLAGGRHDPASPGMSPLQSIYAEALGYGYVDERESFRSLGGDSLGYIQVSLAIEDLLGKLPDDWEDLPIEHVEALAKASIGTDTDRSHRSLATDVLLRPVALILIVTHHVMGPPSPQGGALALLILCGLTFGRFQSDKALSDQRFAILSSFFQRFLIPYYHVLMLYDLLTANDFGLSSLLLVNNIVPDPNIVSTLVFFWFIQALLHCISMTVILLSIPPVRRLALHSSWCFGFFLLALALVLKIGAEYLRGGYDPLHQFSTEVWAYAFALGWLVSQARNTSRRVLALLTTYAVVGWDLGFFSSYAVIAGGSVAAVLFVPSVKMWRGAAGIIAFVAQATYFIYLIQGISIGLFYNRLGITSVPANVFAALVFGCLSYLAWQATMGVLLRRTSQSHRRFASPEDASPYKLAREG